MHLFIEIPLFISFFFGTQTLQGYTFKIPPVPHEFFSDHPDETVADRNRC